MVIGSVCQLGIKGHGSEEEFQIVAIIKNAVTDFITWSSAVGGEGKLLSSNLESTKIVFFAFYKCPATMLNTWNERIAQTPDLVDVN